MFADLDPNTVLGVVAGIIGTLLPVGAAIAGGIAWILNYLAARAKDQQVYLDDVFKRFETMTDKHAAIVDKIHGDCARERQEGSKVLAALSGSVTKLANRINQAFPGSRNE